MSVVTATDLKLTLLVNVILTYLSMPKSDLRTIMRVRVSVDTSVLSVLRLFRTGTIMWFDPKNAGIAD